jgi:hypothetical protein
LRLRVKDVYDVGWQIGYRQHFAVSHGEVYVIVLLSQGANSRERHNRVTIVAVTSHNNYFTHRASRTRAITALANSVGISINTRPKRDWQKVHAIYILVESLKGLYANHDSHADKEINHEQRQYRKN